MTREGEKEGEREDRLGRTFSCSKQPSHTTPFLQQVAGVLLWFLISGISAQNVPWLFNRELKI